VGGPLALPLKNPYLSNDHGQGIRSEPAEKGPKKLLTTFFASHSLVSRSVED